MGADQWHVQKKAELMCEGMDDVNGPERHPTQKVLVVWRPTVIRIIGNTSMCWMVEEVCTLHLMQKSEWDAFVTST